MIFILFRRVNDNKPSGPSCKGKNTKIEKKTYQIEEFSEIGESLFRGVGGVSGEK